MADVVLVIRPQAAAQQRQQTVEISYLRAFKQAEGLPSTARDAVRATLSTSLEGSAELPAAVEGSTIDALFLGGAGLPQLIKRAIVPAAGGQVLMELSASDVSLLAAPDPLPPRPVPLVGREGRLVPVGDAPVDFGSARLEVAPLTLAADWQEAGLDKLFGSQNPLTTAAAVELADPSWAGYGKLSWRASHLGVDGEFAAEFPLGSGDAWVWWMSGSRSALGLVPDDLGQRTARRIAIALPPFAQPPDTVPPEPGAPCPGPSTPKDVTEAELADNPEIYSEDPGQFCKPFENPERVLGERRFHVVLRAEQPGIGPDPTIHGSGFLVLDPEIRDSRRGSRLRRALRLDGIEGPRSLARALADLGTSVVRHTLPKTYLDVLSRLDRGRGQLDGPHPVQWEGDAFRYQAATVARGHILEYSLRWRSNGYSLGTVASTLTLAPRQAKRIQKILWERRERAERREVTQLVDEVADEVSRERDYEDQVRASLDEWARGESRASSTAVAGGFGGVVGSFLIGGGGGHSNATSSSSQQGGRRAVASEEQRLRDTTRRFAESLRRLESTVVSEVSQEESVTGTTEVIRNYNYGHSLTVIYYQILRHLRVETAFTGVRECLFVPFAVSPFTLLRAYRWRESIRRGLRDQRYLQALRHLRDVATGFSQSDIPPGRRSDHRVRHVSGSLFLTLGVERPKDKDTGEFDDVAWTVLKQWLGVPALGIHGRLKALVEAQRDRQFQQEYAPRIAAGWVDSLQLSAGGQPLPADFTLATRYSFNGQVRVDFSVPVPAGQAVTRELLSSLRLKATSNLTPGSVANLTRLSFEYQTDTFHRSATVTQGADDLVNVETGLVEPAGATVSAPPDPWERRDERMEMVRSAQELVRHLNEHVEHYHKAIWWNMDRDRLFMLLDGFYLPSAPTVSVASVVERDPIAIIGNSLVFRVSAGSFLGLGNMATPEDLHRYYANEYTPSQPLHISLPTDGLYAQTIMDPCTALEEHFGNQDWVLAQEELELGTLAPELLASRRTTPEPTTPTPFPQSIVNLQNAPEAPEPAGLAGMLAAITKADSFRDMAGLAGTQANAQAAFTAAAGLASQFGAHAAALKLAEIAGKAQATRTADQKLASIQKAVDGQLVPPEEAQAHAAQVLNDLHSPTKGGAPHQDPQLAEAIDAASGTPGSTIEATTPEGQVKVTLADYRPSWTAEQCGFWGRGQHPLDEAAVRDEIVRVAQAESAAWIDVAGNLVLEGAATHFGHLVLYWLEEVAQLTRETLTAIATNALDPATNYGNLPGTINPAGLAADVQRVVSALVVGVPTPPANLRALVEQAVRKAQISSRNPPDPNPANIPGAPWSACFVNRVVRLAESGLNLEGHATGAQQALLALSSRGAHWEYAKEAHRRTVGCKQGNTFDASCRRDGTYHAFQPAGHEVKPGDIVLQDRRRPVNAGGVFAFDDLATTTGVILHGDIVVDVQPGFAETVGGNVGESVRRRRYPLDANGELQAVATQRWIQESNARAFGALPEADPGGNPLHERSMARVFAVLSLKKECKLIQGPPADGTRIA
ncbi:DUF2272 domain-containing protein [Streptomyces sp. NPDC001581]|uniref:DUF2272 domain-containing protein n=1 Tax=Streptomyces sp. NPDC001581 TaxID=3154386 RepID=UPI0033304CD3